MTKAESWVTEETGGMMRASPLRRVQDERAEEDDQGLQREETSGAE
jgi:hypothetical protein